MASDADQRASAGRLLGSCRQRAQRPVSAPRHHRADDRGGRRFGSSRPAYANRPPPYEGPLLPAEAASARGTGRRPEVTVRARSNRPLRARRARVSTTVPSRPTLDPRSAVAGVGVGVWRSRGRFELTKCSGKGTLRVVDVDGTRSTAERTLPLTLLVDEAPRVRIVEPPPISLATPPIRESFRSRSSRRTITASGPASGSSAASTTRGRCPGP